MRLLSFPFRLSGDGSVATVAQGTAEAAAEAVGVLCLTRRGERTLAPDYGITDPAFAGITPTDVAIGLIDYGPADTRLGDVATTYPNDTTAITTITITTTEE